MKKISLIYLLSLLGFYGCSDGDIEMARFNISSRDVATGSYINGGTYRVLDINKNVVATYTLDKGSVDITNLPGKNYTIEEVTPPEGYVNTQEGQKMEYVFFNNNSADYVFLYVNEDTREIPESVDLQFHTALGNKFHGEYNAVRIGEYYWMSQNFNHVIAQGVDFENKHPITQQTLDTYMPLIDMSPSDYQLSNINDFEKYYGRYYSYPSILYMNEQGYMLNQYNQKEEGWKLPSPADYRQLFAMCPFNTSHDPPHTVLNERDVRFALGPKPNDNPMAYNIQRQGPYDVYWFDAVNTTNMYNFSLMPGGARLNGPSRWCNGLGCYNGNIGDIYLLFYTAYLAVLNPGDPLSIGAVVVEDHVNTKEMLLYHLLNVRWCRALTDTELGYKLYINADQTDIKKLDLNIAIPDGYKELPHGYVRGFYVQYIMNNSDPKVTVSDIVNYSRNVDDNYIAENKTNTNIVF